MRAGIAPVNPMQALIKAIYEVRPPVLKGMKIDSESRGIEVVHLEVALTPELVRAWGEHCKDIDGPGRPFPQPPAERKL